MSNQKRIAGVWPLPHPHQIGGRESIAHKQCAKIGELLLNLRTAVILSNLPRQVCEHLFLAPARVQTLHVWIVKHRHAWRRDVVITHATSPSPLAAIKGTEHSVFRVSMGETP